MSQSQTELDQLQAKLEMAKQLTTNTLIALKEEKESADRAKTAYASNLNLSVYFVDFLNDIRFTTQLTVKDLRGSLWRMSPRVSTRRPNTVTRIEGRPG